MSAATLPATPYLTLCLIPYNGAPPCYVSSAEEYTAAAASYNAAGTEEWDTEVCDGRALNSDMATLIAARHTMQPDELFALAGWLEGADEHKRAAAHYLLRHCSNGYSCAGDVVDGVEDVQLFKGSEEEYANQYAKDRMRETPELRCYVIDWESAVGMDNNIATFQYDGDEWVCTNALDV